MSERHRRNDPSGRNPGRDLLRFPHPDQFPRTAILIPGPSTVQLAIDGLAAPRFRSSSTAGSPAFFELDQQHVIATLPDGSVITARQTGQAGDYVVFYATGLGAVVPPLDDREVPMTALTIEDIAQLSLLLGRQSRGSQPHSLCRSSAWICWFVPDQSQLPAGLSANPEVRVSSGNQISPKGLPSRFNPNRAATLRAHSTREG